MRSTSRWPRRPSHRVPGRSATSIAARRRSTCSRPARAGWRSATRNVTSVRATASSSRRARLTSSTTRARSRWCCCAAARRRTPTRTRSSSSVRRALVLAALLAAALLSAPAHAAKPKPKVNDPAIGVGEQSPALFGDPYFEALRVRHVRYVVGWDALRTAWSRAQVDQWMAAAHAAKVDVLLAFNVSRDATRHDVVPTVAQYRRVFLGFRKRYPFVHEFISWNEGNHHSQPTAKRPWLAARYFAAAQRACPRCKIVAADLLDDDTVPRWVRAFRRHAKVKPRIWGIHNYIDANRFRTSGTRTMLRVTRGQGQLWFTETGGLVWRRGGLPLHESAPHAAKATRWVFKLANLSRRVRRVYFYHWTFPAVLDRWDSAIMDRHGRPRPAYRVLRAHIRAERRR